ncbi:ketosteroid isomerase family protein [Mycobacterium sp. URHB0044]|uniref:nuclear transport factor 2 family protein n=1 Tax=Mycobacterium sp. URHB0044 TaxID=1380386 RepID=UPI00048F8E0F|nr:ketosteroid isomerase family protein [Mycobacterium sp. URHB0044]
MPHHETAGAAPTRAELLAAVEKSPAAAGRHDRRAWVGLFTTGGRIEDPVGSRPHRGRDAIERFYDTFIGPRDITFHRDADVVVGSTVVRDLELEVSMADSLVMRIPAYLRYDVEREDGTLKIAALQAFWELPAMVMQFARGGPAAVPAGLSLSRALLANQGAGGTVGFVSGFRGVGARGKRELAEFLDAACAGDELAIRRRLSDRALITLGDDERMGASELVGVLAGGQARKLIAAGRTVAAGIEAGGRRHVLFADAGAGPPVIGRIRLFTEVG